MPVTITKWSLAPNSDLPDPELNDDSVFFLEDEVRRVREWLLSTLTTFQNTPPPPMQLVCGTGKNSGMRFMQKNSEKKIGRVTFTHGTIEVILRTNDSAKMPIAKYVYVVARTLQGKMIVGPQVKREIVGQL